MTAYWPPYATSFRGLPACDCQIEFIPELEEYLRFLDIGFQGTLSIAQMIGLIGQSGNTHGDPDGDGIRKGGGVTDYWITGALADRCVRAMRDMGADATWHRPFNWDGENGSEHVHSVQRGCPHLTVQAAAQVWAVDHNGDGLIGDAPDPGPRPLSGRTWQQGIQWAHDQEDKVNQEDIDKIVAGVAALLTEDKAIGLKQPDGTKKPITRDAALERVLND